MSDISATLEDLYLKFDKVFERLKKLESRDGAGTIRSAPEIFKSAVEIPPETAEITVSREETRQISQYEPVRLSTSVTFQVSGNTDTAIMTKHDELRGLLKQQFERESILRLEEKNKTKAKP